MRRKLLFNPGPTNVSEEVRKALLTENYSHRDKEFTDVLKRVNANLLKICNGEETHSAIPFVASGTGANEAIFSSIHDKLLIIENGRYSKRLIEICRKLLINIEVISFDPLKTINFSIIENIISKDMSIKYIVAVHHETTTSMVIPLRQLGNLARKYNKSLIIDSISSIGAQSFDLQLDNISFCTVSANKCLESFPGISFVLAKTEEIKQLKGRSRSYYFDLYNQWEYSLKGRTPFTAAIQLFFALDKALSRLLEEGCENRAKRYNKLNSYLREKLNELGINAVNIPNECRSNILTLYHLPNNISLSELHSKMKERGIIIYSDEETAKKRQFFLATMGDISFSDIDYFVKNFEEVINIKGKTADEG